MLLLAAPVSAHRFDPALVELLEQTDGRWQIATRWPEAPAQDAILWPEGCQAQLLDAGGELRCAGAGPLHGELGVRDRLDELLVHVRPLAGGERYGVARPGHPYALGVAVTRAHGVRPTWSFFPLGALHVLGGIDHVLLVLLLTLLGPGLGALLWRLTAFTIGHSITLALSALAIVDLPQPPTEALIALTLVLLAREVLRQASTSALPSARRPTNGVVLALGCGLVHGLGFASGLRELGLPTDSVLPALLAFNLGVEAGQVLVVVPLVALAELAARAGRLPALCALLARPAGVLGVALVCDRLAGFVRLVPLLLLASAGLLGCSKGHPVVPERREPCTEHNPDRNLYFGDLHVHTTNSFDAHAFDVRTTPAEAYGFAQGMPVALAPLDADGRGTQTLKLDRPLDFAAVTDHSEYLGEVQVCSIPGAPGYDSSTCQGFRKGSNAPVTVFGIVLSNPEPERFVDVCGIDGHGCEASAGQVWAGIQAAAEAAYDRTAACKFTSFVAYEYSASTGYSTMHRNVIFRGDAVPPPISYFDRPTPEGLWEELRAACIDGLPGCDVLAIPHNPNESNGNMFHVDPSDTRSLEEQRDAARLRADLEPLLEIYQHKGASECFPGLGGVVGAPDEACGFEGPRRSPIVDCGDDTGAGGVARNGCLSRVDFARGILLEGLREAGRLGVNPFRVGLIASTDTHNGTPGAVEEADFIGHRGTDDATVEQRLGTGSLTPGGIEFSPGGLTAVWAEDRSRSAIFDALRRREAYATSGPRIAVRMFGGWGFDAATCQDPELVRHGYAAGVPMGADLPARPLAGAAGAAPSFVISALRDAGTEARPGAPLERIQVIKGWIDRAGTAHEQVFDVATGAVDTSIDETSCARSSLVTPPGSGDALCASFVDPAFDPQERAFYYARVLEAPSCRWSWRSCLAIPEASRPPTCSDPTVPRIIRERAWTSPIWYAP